MTKIRTRAQKPSPFRVLLRCWLVVVAAWLLIPTLIVVPMSFSSATTFQFPPPGWSLQWYGEFFTSQKWLTALWSSIQVAVVSAVLAVILGVAAAIGFAKWTHRGKSAIRGLIMAPMIVPLVVIGIAIYSAFLNWNLAGGMLGFILAHTVLAIPFVFVAVSASLENYDSRLDMAAATMGAKPLSTFFTITVPLIMPGIASGFLFALVTSFDEVVVALFLQSPSFTTLPVVMFNAVSLDIDPTVAAASTLIVAVTSLIILAPEAKRLWSKK